MNIVAAHPGRQIHIVLDQLNTHKSKQDYWLKAHPNGVQRSEPLDTAWSQFRLPRQLRDASDRIVNAYNKAVAPHSSEAKQSSVLPLKTLYSDFCK